MKERTLLFRLLHVKSTSRNIYNIYLYICVSFLYYFHLLQSRMQIEALMKLTYMWSVICGSSRLHYLA